VVVSPDGRRILSGSTDQTVAVWDLELGTRLATFTFDSSILSAAWHREGRDVLIGDNVGNLYRFEYLEH
jgi:WD40 repeat protein